MAVPRIDIEKLSPEERLQLIEDLWESLRARPETVPVTDGQRAELDQRLDALDRGEGRLVSWDEAKRQLRD